MLHWTTNGKVFNTMVSHDFNMTSFRSCCHNWLACICFCACICLLSRIFCLACYRLCVEQLLAFHWDTGEILWFAYLRAWMLFRKCHNKFLFLDFLRLLWYWLGIGHYWLDIFRWVDIGVFLYSCMFLQYYLFGDWLFFCYAY